MPSMAEHAAQPVKEAQENQVTDNRDKKDGDTSIKPDSESQQPASTETTDPDGDDESSSELEESDDEVNPEGYRPRGKPSKPLASQSKPGGVRR
ncbi:hypothetical protein PENSPDRAFT_754577 [Peniophora sp. CONT]|nr:hypothetical protein PENSPDRAFT_754577 [Peniophora sp. CONT]